MAIVNYASEQKTESSSMSYREFKAWLEGFSYRNFEDNPSNYELNLIRDTLLRVTSNHDGVSQNTINYTEKSRY